MASPPIRIISTTTVRPSTANQDDPLLPLTPWDLLSLTTHYIQKGLLFSHKPTNSLLPHLTTSLSQALSLFYPLAGRLVTHSSPDSSSAAFYIDCNGAGAEFIHASADALSVADVFPADVPTHIVYAFFPLNGAVNHDGHSLPLLVVQLTELSDGFFLGCSFNHVVGDGTAFWHFFSSWAEIARTGSVDISRPPVISRFFPTAEKEEEQIVRVPFTNPHEFVQRFDLPPLKDRFFHFTAQSIAKLKAQAQQEAQTTTISSFQALSALAWRAIVRARKVPAGETTSCRFTADCRPRLAPSLPNEYFGNSIGNVSAEAVVGQLLGNGLGWAALRLHESIKAYDGSAARAALEAYGEAPWMFRLKDIDDGRAVRTGSSPRFDVYGVDFGWGRAEAVRSGIDNKFVGKITAFPGREGSGATELEICLPQEAMEALEADEEFMCLVQK